jgi:hypothetical protein
MRMRQWIMIVIAAAGLGGCAAAGLTVAGAGAGVGMASGVDHTLSGTVYKTFSAPVNELRLATLRTLDRMDMPLTRDEQTAAGWTIGASATQRSIEIELERLTRSTSRMKVTADKGDFFFKDSATATEIVTQIALSVDEQRNRRAAAAQPAPTPVSQQRRVSQ